MNIGETLKQKRIEMGLSFEEVYYHLKIKIDYLKQIEENNFQNLPEPPFVKVFIRSYANFLGLDGDQIAKEFEKQIYNKQSTEENTIVKEKEEINFIKKNRLAIILIIVAVILIIFSIWKILFLNNKINYDKKIVDSSNASLETLKLINNEVTNTNKKKENTQKKDSILTKIENKINSHTLKIISIDTVWLTYKIDTLPTIEHFFRINNIGDSITLKFKDSINLKIGNAAGVIMVLNNDTIKNIGKKGQTTFLKIDSTFFKK